MVDQLTKWWALDTLATRSIDIVWTLRFRLAFNTGAAFSMGQGSTFSRYIPFLALVVVGIVIWQGRTIGTKLGSVALGLIIGGAVGNLVDRAFRAGDGGFFSGAVIDFIDLQWFPVFNIADSAVVIGGILLVFVSLRLPADDAEAAADADVGSGSEEGSDPDSDSDSDSGSGSGSDLDSGAGSGSESDRR